MPIVEQAQAILDLKSLELPPAPRVLSIAVEPTVDTDGENALRVYVVTPDDTQESELRGGNVMQLKRAIHQRLIDEGIELFPYVFLRTESERREELEEARH